MNKAIASALLCDHVQQHHSMQHIPKGCHHCFEGLISDVGGQVANIQLAVIWQFIARPHLAAASRSTQAWSFKAVTTAETTAATATTTK